MLATSEGCLRLKVRNSVANLHDQALVHQASLVPSWDRSHWGADAFTALLLDSSLPRTQVAAAFCLRALTFRPPPVTVHYYSYDFCDTHMDHPRFHVTHACPAFLQRGQWAFVRLLVTLAKLSDSYLPKGTTMIQPKGGTFVSVAMDTDKGLPAAPPPPPLHKIVVFSPMGLVHYIHTPDCQCTRFQRRSPDGARGNGKACSPLANLLMILDTLEWPTRPHPTLNSHVEITRPQSVLPLSVALFAQWMVCHLQIWRMLAGGCLQTVVAGCNGQSYSVLRLFQIGPHCQMLFL